jgi:hypothetical protein
MILPSPLDIGISWSIITLAAVRGRLWRRLASLRPAETAREANKVIGEKSSDRYGDDTGANQEQQKFYFHGDIWGRCMETDQSELSERGLKSARTFALCCLSLAHPASRLACEVEFPMITSWR